MCSVDDKLHSELKTDDDTVKIWVIIEYLKNTISKILKICEQWNTVVK